MSFKGTKEIHKFLKIDKFRFTSVFESNAFWGAWIQFISIVMILTLLVNQMSKLTIRFSSQEPFAVCLYFLCHFASVLTSIILLITYTYWHRRFIQINDEYNVLMDEFTIHSDVMGRNIILAYDKSQKRYFLQFFYLRMWLLLLFTGSIFFSDCGLINAALSNNLTLTSAINLIMFLFVALGIIFITEMSTLFRTISIFYRVVSLDSTSNESKIS